MFSSQHTYKRLLFKLNNTFCMFLELASKNKLIVSRCWELRTKTHTFCMFFELRAKAHNLFNLL